ncbi:dephospho-CoA kinase [Lactobacillus alvi]|uniref:Dephospho-CoA kinase n=1 Tax=Limosilactobacillus alvi TaxID=990412 RepID=A0ABS2EN49_9LACO|nr:dephospho-CoA kinase [Limosilactobacillus alvi]MBM6753938.1 dephospho-CoA kinase [Limosilactobacillus alvi]
MTKVLGLTGGIATGKSTVSKYLAQKGAVIIDGDLIARRVVEPHQLGLKRLVAAFGSQILASDGTLLRAKLGEMVFGDVRAETKLNQALGPIIHQEFCVDLKKARANQVKLVVLDIPLLFEGGYETMCDAVMVVAVKPATQLKRLMARNHYNKATAQARINAQWPLEQKQELANVVIDNEGSIMNTYLQVDNWLFKWL